MLFCGVFSVWVLLVLTSLDTLFCTVCSLSERDQGARCVGGDRLSMGRIVDSRFSFCFSGKCQDLYRLAGLLLSYKILFCIWSAVTSRDVSVWSSYFRGPGIVFVFFHVARFLSV